MKTLRERFQHLDSRFLQYLENVIARLPAEFRDSILEQDDLQLIADDGFLDKCILRQTFKRPFQTLAYINTKILKEPDHRIILAIASQVAFYVCSKEKTEPECQDAEELLKQWGFKEELNAVRYDEVIAQSDEYQAGYRWAKKQSKDYLRQHFGLYFDQWNTKGWSQESAALAKEIEGQKGTASILEELTKGKVSEVPEKRPSPPDAQTPSPRQAVLAGIMSALKEIQLKERYGAHVCELAPK